MLLSKGLRFNTYQQMQQIQASANQSSISLLHAPAGADDCRKVSHLTEKDQIQTHVKSSLGYASQLTRSWLNIPALCTLLPADTSGMAGQMCCSLPAHLQWSSQKAPTLGPPQTPPTWGGNVTLPLERGTAGGRVSGCRGFAFRVLEGNYWNCSRWDASFPTFSNPHGFSRQHKASLLQLEAGAQLSEVIPSSEQPMQFLMSMTMAKVSQPTENSHSQHPAVSLHEALWCCYKGWSSPAQRQPGHTAVSHCHPSVSTWAIQVSKTAAVTAFSKSTV